MVHTVSAVILATVALNAASTFATPISQFEPATEGQGLTAVPQPETEAELADLDTRQESEVSRRPFTGIGPEAPLPTQKFRPLTSLPQPIVRPELQVFDGRGLGSIFEKILPDVEKVLPFASSPSSTNQNQNQQRDLEEFSDILGRSIADELEARGLGSIFEKILPKVESLLPFGSSSSSSQSQNSPQRRDLEQLGEILARSGIDELDARGLGSLFEKILPKVESILPFGSGSSSSQSQNPQRRDLEKLSEILARSGIDELDARGLGSLFEKIIPKVESLLPFGSSSSPSDPSQSSQQQRRDLERLSELFARSDIDELDARGLGSLFEKIIPKVESLLPFGSGSSSSDPSQTSQQQRRDLERLSELFARSDIDELDERGIGNFIKPALPFLKKVLPFVPLAAPLIPQGGDSSQNQTQTRALRELSDILARSDIDELDERGIGNFIKPALPYIKKILPFVPLVAPFIPQGGDSSQNQTQSRALKEFSDILGRSAVDELEGRGLGSLFEKIFPKVESLLPFGSSSSSSDPSQSSQQQRRDLEKLSELFARSDIDELDERGIGNFIKPALPFLKKVLPFVPLAAPLIPQGGDSSQNQTQSRALQEFSDILGRSVVEELEARGIGSFLKPLKNVLPFVPLAAPLIPQGQDNDDQSQSPPQKRAMEEFSTVLGRELAELETRGADIGTLMERLLVGRAFEQLENLD